MGKLKWRSLLFAALLIATLLLTACVSDAAESIAPVGSKSVSAARGPVVSEFSVSTGQDTSFSLSDHRGDVVILYFSFPG